MRDYRFRAWHKEDKEMFFEDRPGDVFRWLNEKQPLEIMQFTGLLDKNGKEIYEGDIVHGNAEANFVVVPMCGGLSIHPLRNLGQKHNELIASPTNDPQTASWLGDSEVIGNIHENGDLLNG